jgi:hypothetical protein
MSFLNTSWGEVCAAAHVRVQQYAGPGAAAPYFETVAFGCGVDDYAKHDKGRTHLAFVGPGSLAGEERFEPTVRGAAPKGYRAVCDRIVPIRCRVFAPFAKTSTNTDTSPETAEILYGLLLAALDEVAHGRAHILEGASMAGGTTGTDGTTIVLAFSLRITVYAPRLLTQRATSTEVAAIETADPAGESTGIMVPGDV